MLITGFILFKFLFGRIAVVGNKTPKYMKRLLAPTYDQLVASQDEARRIVDLPHERLTITTDDGLTLVGRLSRSETPSKRTIICCHGYKSNGIDNYGVIAKGFLKKGYNTLVIDHRTSGDSQGKWVGFGNLESKDTAKWVAKINEIFEGGDVFLTGVSMGGATVATMSALDLPSVRAIAADCAFNSVYAELKHIYKFVAHLPAFPFVDATEFWCKRIAGYDFKHDTPLMAVGKAKYPMLFIHGDSDNFITPDHAQRFFDACPTQKQLHFIEGAGHGACFLADGYYDTLTDFFNQYATVD